jgi:hypothetical protein
MFEKQLQWAIAIIVLSVCLEDSTATGQIVVKFYVWVFLTKTVEQVKVWLKLDRNNTLHEDLCLMTTCHCL